MDITITAQKPVSEFLKVAQELVSEVREWANVLWVRVVGCRPRFVSKKVIKSVEIDSRIPQDLEEARKISGIRFHDWDEASRQMVQKFMSIEGKHAQLISNGTIYPSHPLHDEVRALTEDDGRWCSAIVTIAAKLNGVYDY